MPPTLHALVLVATIAGCDKGDATPDQPDARTAAPTCTDFLVLEARWYRRELPYLEPDSGMRTPGGRVYVAGTFESLWGESDPQPDGTTLVWAPKLYHREDGTIELGAAGRRDPADTTCEWATPARVQP